MIDNLIENSSISRENISYNQEKKIFTIIKWDWDYQDALNFQFKCVDFVKQNKQVKFFIFCSHPHCFTMGRGLQKDKGAPLEKLIEFDDSIIKQLPYPLYNIKRGGGLTFHYPGQWIFYPIVGLNSSNLSIKNLVYNLLKSVSKCLEDLYQVDNLTFNKKLLGLWRGNYKLASVGFGIERFISFHGLALNGSQDNQFFNDLKMVNPCGLDSGVYTNIEQLFEQRQVQFDSKLFTTHYILNHLEGLL